MKFVSSIAVLAVGILLIVFCHVTHDFTVQGPPPIPPPENVEHFTLGYNDTVADVFWLRLIQDIDYCEGTKAKNQATCSGTNLGWVYHMLDTVTKIAPKFLIAYQSGATIMSVVVHDPEGASRIFARGLENFPHEWPLEYVAAYHELFGVKNTAKAAELLTRAGADGAPGWVYALAGRLYSKEGQATLAKSVLKSVIDDDPGSRWAPTLKKELDDIDKNLKESQPTK